MLTNRRLPAEFLRHIESLEAAYLMCDDPIRQSGFSGDPERWRAERGPILQAVEQDGEMLDLGCANGHLLWCLVEWARERGIALEPYGVDIGSRLIERAKWRFPKHRASFFVGNAWEWQPPKRFRYVYALYDCVPLDFLQEYVERIVTRMVSDGGRVILGAYGSRSQGSPPFDVGSLLAASGFTVAGTAYGGDPPVTSFAWIDRP